MTHQNHQTNGASLEDCHTNFFALTELYGIKWRKLVWGESGGSGGCGSGGGCGCSSGEEGCAPLADPVISSYARCLAGDILCVWRRAPDTAHDPPLALHPAKELWIFWYGEEPDLSGLVAPELIASQGDQGSWEIGLSYECRSLLFKALHNLIERCLLSRDFVRLGKWFVQPYDGDEEDVGKSPWHLSFSFAFFLHGESTVCASVDVRQHPPVRTLTRKRRVHLAAPTNRHNAKVILAPFGLEGTLTGREWTESDPATARLLEGWRHLYPLEHGCGAVEVICGGVRMRYPVPYALVTDLQPPPAPAPAAAALAKRCLMALTTPQPHQTAELCYGEVSIEKGEDFVDPTRKSSCSCAKGVASGGAACSPGSCGGGSPAAAVSAPSSAGAPPPSPHHTALQQHQGGCVPTTLHTPAPTPDPHAPTTPAPPSHPPKLYAQGESPDGVGAGTGSGGWCGEGCELAPRPALPPAERRLDPLEDEHSLHMLYDYTTVHAWLEHPVKRFKSEENTFREELALGIAGGDLYAGHEHTSMPAMPDHQHISIKQEKQEHEDVKEYKNLFTSDGLCPTLKDLDQIFDNSDDGGVSGDETVRLLQVQTPPDSNKSVDEARCGAARCVRPEELIKMFPTPPSMEAHAQPSPGATPIDDATTILHHHHHQLLPGSPPIEPIEDWSYVFKPAAVCKYVGSSKYAPLAVLPSQLLPAVPLPPHAVYRPRWLDAKPPQRDTDTDTVANQHKHPHRTGTKRSASPVAETREPREAREESRVSAPSPASLLPSPASPASPRATAHACPLLLNVLLADTLLNIFRDHNFDSCTLCVCNAGPKMVGSIRGADAAMYLNGGGAASGGEQGPGSPVCEEYPARCTCGFSAVVNRRLAHKAGLFYEDEMEITGMVEEPSLRGGRPGLAGVAGALAAQCAALGGGGASALARAAQRLAALRPNDDLTLNQLDYCDGGSVASRALRAAAAGSVCGGNGTVHRWPFIGARTPRSTRDVVRLMRRLRPLLQDAIQKRCSGARMWDGVTGPLTWRQFHRLAGRGNEDLCEPQPVPPLLVGHDRDWVSLSPYALRHWERLALEPYAYSRDVAYVVLAADGDILTDPLKTFFRELSTAYETCRLGRHQPICRIAKDGLVRTSPNDHRNSNCEEWTGELPPGRLGEYIRSYAETLRTTIVPLLAALTIDRTLFETESKTVQMERPSPSPMRPPSTPDHPPTPSSQSDQESEACGPTNGQSGLSGGSGGSSSGGGLGSASGGSCAWESEEGGGAALVVYVVEPPVAHAHRAHALHALLRLAAQTYNSLQHQNPLIKIISLEGVCEWWGGCGGRGSARALAFSVFAGARPLLAHAPNGKSLTGFGTAAQDNLFIKSKDETNRAPYALFSPAWVLACGTGRGRELSETWGQGCGEGGAVLFVAYCLSHDQRWLLAAATDARGELLETAAINIHVPHRIRRHRQGPARRLGLTKLMDFTVGVMSQTAQPWRLVVGRVGRIGHGELKGWSWLLSRKNLFRTSSVLRSVCGACDTRYPSAAPCILSACLISTEPEPTMRLMADRFTPDERFSQHSMNSHLHTPRDVTATHILVFPTSATTQSNQGPYEPRENGEGNDMLFPDMDMVDEDIGEDNMTDLLIGDMFSMWPQNSPRASPRRADDEVSRDGSPARHQPHHHAYHQHDDNAQEQVGNVLQQPLALGYLVSTAPLGGMPSWWTRGGEDGPAFLKSALHLHTGNVQATDDVASFTQRRDHNAHPLDSTTTTDVLRYVLEGYNALSWLSLDERTHDRRSCLPLHVQVLMQLYHAAAALG